MFNYDAPGNVYNRVEMLTKTGFVGASLKNLQQAWFGEYAERMIVVQYNSLTKQPADVIARLYDALGEERFDHDFDHVEYDVPELDDYLSLPEFHKVSGPIRDNSRKTILLPDLFDRFEPSFWEMPGQNPRGVLII